MINFNTILSSYDERGTLLKWLKSLQEALEGGALSTVNTTTGDDYVIFHFIFADGTSVDSPSIPLEAGPQGPQGQPGVPGTAATVAIGTVSTLPAGSDATVTNSGTSAAAVLNFGIPQGANGSPGEVIEQIVPVEATTTASRAYSIGDYFVNNLGVLVQATANIASGATIDSTNSSAVNATLSDQLASLENSLNDSGSGYCKLPDGTLIQFGYLSLGSQAATAAGSFYTAEWNLGANEGVFPIQFVGTYGLTVAPTDGSFQIITALESTSSKITKVSGGRPTSGNVNGNFRYIAVGKWK